MKEPKVLLYPSVLKIDFHFHLEQLYNFGEMNVNKTVGKKWKEHIYSIHICT